MTTPNPRSLLAPFLAACFAFVVLCVCVKALLLAFAI